MPTLLRDAYFVLERYAAPSFVRLARTAEPLANDAQAARSVLGCRHALGELDPTTIGILIDWRLSPASASEDPLEVGAVREAEAFAARFGRAAVLLLAAAATAPAWSGARVRVFRDEEAAIAYVCSAC